MSPREIRALLDERADELADWLMLRRAAEDECEEPVRRVACALQADEALDGLAADLAAQLGARKPATFTVDVRDVRRGPIDYALITVCGHLDEETAPQVREAVKGTRAADGYRSIAIDLTKASVHGSKGLSPLVNAFFCARRFAEREFYLIAGAKMERRVLNQIAGGSLRTFATAAELDEALDAEPLAGAL